jgi:peptidoglycan biosynthesis protein MviN/MurJ (putative lipid II flippase)
MIGLSRFGWLGGIAENWGVSAGTVNRWEQAAGLAVVLFPYMIFVCLAAAFSAALQTLNRFLEPALSPLGCTSCGLGLLRLLLQSPLLLERQGALALLLLPLRCPSGFDHFLLAGVQLF